MKQEILGEEVNKYINSIKEAKKISITYSDDSGIHYDAFSFSISVSK
tara:strand:+ start:247 stop:387 length:141 start_codon:yes stop_codon:yes gene_type:complete